MVIFGGDLRGEGVSTELCNCSLKSVPLVDVFLRVDYNVKISHTNIRPGKKWNST